jgi:hypothetical protein
MTAHRKPINSRATSNPRAQDEAERRESWSGV